MKKTLLAAGAILMTTAVYGQRFQSGYVTFPGSSSLITYVNQWNGGTGTLTVDGKAWEDEEFFTSRVKPRARFVNRAAQSNDLTDANDKRLLWWCPLDQPEKQGLQNAMFDSEAFSMWSYMDHFGSFTGPWGWSTGAMADAAHKNGVGVSGVASIPQGITADWSSALGQFINMSSDANAQAIAKFLYYHGCDGLAYNSEYSNTSCSGSAIAAVHAKINTWMKDRNPVFENIWYDGTGDTGVCSFDSFLSGKTAIFKEASMFSNYNWVNESRMGSAITTANGLTSAGGVQRSNKYLYAGMNMEGSEPHSGGAYPMLDKVQWSLGYWGAHRVNMLWQGRNTRGSSADAQQASYLDRTEKFFSNGVRNPAVHLSTVNSTNHGPTDSWHGMSHYMSARSSIDHTIANEAFYTYFNMGNGKFFNIRGHRASNVEWYSLGFQDFLPTWRFWFAPSFMQKGINASDQHLTADMTYTDAYMGGSCLKISGTSSKEYLHLFKTKLTVASSNKIVVRYKLLEGEANVRLVFSTFNQPTTPYSNNGFDQLNLFTLDEVDDVMSQSYTGDGWVTKVFNISSGAATAFKNATTGGGVGVIALEFTNAKDLNMLIGELGIYKGSKTTASEDDINKLAAPNAPVIVRGTTLNNTFSGVDGKLVWKMENNKAAGEPCYNSDVNVSYFKLWAQEEGGETQFMGVTTSWAGLIYQAFPAGNNNVRIRFGVSAVAADGFNESDIAWDSYRSKGSYTCSDDIAISKLVIKPNESFEISYVDPNHASSTWTIGTTAADGTFTALKTATGTKIEVPGGLPNVGGYDVYLDRGTTAERAFGYYVQVSGESTGALPEVYSLGLNENDLDANSAVEINITDTPTLTYTGRPADGVGSRAMELAARYIGSNVGTLGLSARSSFSVCGWFKFKEIPDATWNFMNVSNKKASWPQNTWGWSWNHGDAQGNVDAVFRGAASDSSSPGELHYTFPDTKFQAGVWTHIACIYEYADAGFRYSLYVNGVKQRSTVYQYATGNNSASCRSFTYGGKTTSLTYTTDSKGNRVGTNSGDIYIYGQNYAIASTDNVYFGGAAHEGKSIDATVDDFQIWNKAMTESEIRQAMVGYSGTLPSGILALWDFEGEPDANYYFAAKGSNTNAKCSNYDYEGTAQSGLSETTYMPVLTAGSPFVPGTAYPVVTTASWKDDVYGTQFTKATSRAATTEDTAGSATVKFKKDGDHNIALTLSNNHGTYTQQFPVFKVIDEATAIDEVGADGSDAFSAYTEGDVLYLQFAADGLYTVAVYNTAGMLVANKQLNATAGQCAQVTIGTPGVYLVNASLDGQLLRTVKVASK